MFKNVVREGKYKGAAIGKYEETRKLRETLKKIEQTIEARWGQSALGNLSGPLSGGALGEPMTLTAAIASASAAIAVVAEAIKEITDSGKLIIDMTKKPEEPKPTGSKVSDITSFPVRMNTQLITRPAAPAQPVQASIFNSNLIKWGLGVIGAVGLGSLLFRRRKSREVSNSSRGTLSGIPAKRRQQATRKGRSGKVLHFKLR
jgi:hypothetical protein